MTTVSSTPTGNVTTPQQGGSSEVRSGKKEISSDFNTFLTMLSAQMRHQDPLNPIESADYATQLATFSGVEQQIKTNDLLQKLIAGGAQDGIASMGAWAGRTVSAPGEINFTGTPVTLDIRSPAGASAVSIEVRNVAGQVVQSLPVNAESGPVQWAGVGSDGRPLPAGRYQFTTVGRNGDQEVGRNATAIYQKVKEARVEGSGVKLVLDGGSTINPSDVLAIRSAS